ncbi:hypothetical protein HFP15_28220 [Amycolatopsis sp. K13G38]|uniref:4Fe-4S ferredoxin-type domain-containing protein n=1 Tax=Amycolatopsis acididurans TaxID=2724524 RepID=A0ABX1JDM6_9PSEU|nr:hypothetical protein [Amycolatopsis acididurans]
MAFREELVATYGDRVRLWPQDEAGLIGLDTELGALPETAGTCETGVLDGIPDHRDDVLTEEERACNDCMLVCVSRSKTPRLRLDL